MGRSNPQKGFTKPGHIFRVQPNGMNFKTLVWAHLGNRETDTSQQANQGPGEGSFIYTI